MCSKVKTQYISQSSKIQIDWTVKKGIGFSLEDFTRSAVSLFLIGAGDRVSVACEAGLGTVTAEVVEGLDEGVYSLELLWVKNGDIHGTRCLQRSRIDKVFCITRNASEAQSQDTIANVKVITHAQPYGYDGLSAYEAAVLRGYRGSENAFYDAQSGGGSDIPAEQLAMLEEMYNMGVMTNRIADLAVTDDKIANGAVSSDKLANGAVEASKIAEGAVTTAKILNNSVSTEKIAEEAITTAKIGGKQVVASKIGDSAVTNAKLGFGAVSEDKIAVKAVSSSKIANSAVTEEKISDSAVTTSKIANGAVTSEKLSPETDLTDKVFKPLDSNTRTYTGLTLSDLNQSGSEYSGSPSPVYYNTTNCKVSVPAGSVLYAVGTGMDNIEMAFLKERASGGYINVATRDTSISSSSDYVYKYEASDACDIYVAPAVSTVTSVKTCIAKRSVKTFGDLVANEGVAFYTITSASGQSASTQRTNDTFLTDFRSGSSYTQSKGTRIQLSLGENSQNKLPVIYDSTNKIAIVGISSGSTIEYTLTESSTATIYMGCDSLSTGQGCDYAYKVLGPLDVDNLLSRVTALEQE